MKILKPLFLIIFFFSLFGETVAKPHPFSADDLVRLNRVSDPQISPEGRYVAYTVRETDMKENRGRSDIWLVDLEGPEAPPRRLTTNDENDASPQWSPRGDYIYFLSTRRDTTQVWRIAMDGGEAQQVTRFPVDISTFKLSPRGDRLAFTARVYPICINFACTENLDQQIAEAPGKGRVYDKLIMRYWDKWRDSKVSRLFSVALKAGRPEGDVANLTEKMQAEVPPYPNNGPGYVFGAKGRYIYFSTKQQDQHESWSTNSDIYRVRANGRGDPKNLTQDNHAADSTPAVSPDGRWLAWLATTGPRRFAAENKIMLMDLNSETMITLAPGWDRSPNSIQFTTDSTAILATANDIGQQPLFYIPLYSGEVEEIPLGSAFPDKASAENTGWISGFSSSDRGIVFARHSLERPADLYYNDDTATRQVTDANADMLAEIEMAGFEQFSFEGANGDTVYGYIMHPAGYEQDKSYPVALIIHGGPHGSMANSFSYRWNPQTYAGAGYATVFIDFHGSTGYGQAFVESIHNKRGSITVEDHQLGLAAVLQTFPWLDGDRVCALGASFGGYTVNILQGAWPDRFRCFVNHDGMFDNRMKYYSGDIIGYLEEGFGGQPYFRDPESHEMFNPANQVHLWKTPMLVIHSEKDYRVPITHGIGAFTALQRKGVPSRFLYFPNENHWVLQPANSLQWHGEVLRWLDQWLKE